MEQFVVVLFLSPLELQQFAQATEETVVTTFLKELFGPAGTARLAIRRQRFGGKDEYLADSLRR